MKNLILSIILLLSSFTFAATTTIVNKCEEPDGRKTESAAFLGDYLFLGKSLDFSGEAEDLIFLGNSLDFSGKARINLIAGGNNVLVSGSTNNGIIAGCKTMVITGQITGTSFIGCKNLHISQEAQIQGDIFAGCGTLTIDSRIDGDMYIGAGKVTINNEINGNVKVYGGRIIITENGSIKGNLSYSTREKLSAEELTRVSGEISYVENEHFKDKGDYPRKYFRPFFLIFKLFLIVSFIIVGVLILFLPVFKKVETDITPKGFLYTALWGLIPIFMYPAVIVISIILGITIPFAILLLLALFPLFFIAQIIGAIKLGQILSLKCKWDIQKRHYHFLIGAALFAILSLIPFVGFLAGLVLASLGWGVYISFLFQKTLVN